MYDTPPTNFEALIAPYQTDVRATASWLRTLIVSNFPGVTEQVSGGTTVGLALYSVGNGGQVAAGIQPGPQFVKLFLHDPELLTGSPFKLEGKGKHMRHIKFALPPTDRREALLELLRIPIERRALSGPDV